MTCNPATDPNCSPSRQGNGTLIPTPPLPPCAPAICNVPPAPSMPIQWSTNAKGVREDGRTVAKHERMGVVNETSMPLSQRGMYMNKLPLTFAITAAAGMLFSSNPMVAQVSPTTPKTAHVRITQGPEFELAKEHLTIISWTTNNPGGSPVHMRSSCAESHSRQWQRGRYEGENT
jgi:hypothetical protein